MRIPWSQTMVKTQRRIIRLHAWIATIQAHAWHQLTTHLVERVGVVAMEDLHVAVCSKIANRPRDRGYGLWEISTAVGKQSGATPQDGHRRESLVFESQNVCFLWIPNAENGAFGAGMDAPACHAHHERAVNAAINLRKLAETSFTTRPGDWMGGCPSVSA